MCGGFYALMRFAGLNPDEFFSQNDAKVEVLAVPSPEKLTQLYDSLENINFAIHKETDTRSLKNLKDTQKNLWERILLARNAINKAEAPKTIKEEESDLVDSLIKGISVTAAILLVIIIFLIIKIKWRSKEVEKVTERLKTLQTEPPAPPPLGGLDPTMFQTRFRQQTTLPQVKPIVADSTKYTQTVKVPSADKGENTEPRPLRKTAKQRVTEAMKTMVAALESLRKYGTTKTKTVNTTEPIAATGRLTKTNIRVPSLNSTKISPPADETTYDRRAREKKQILDWARQGRTPSEIAKWLELPRDQVETVIRLARERGE